MLKNPTPREVWSSEKRKTENGKPIYFAPLHLSVDDRSRRVGSVPAKGNPACGWPAEALRVPENGRLHPPERDEGDARAVRLRTEGRVSGGRLLRHEGRRRG